MTKLFVLIFLGTAVCFSQESDYSKIPQLQTTATFTTEVDPDRIVLSIMLSEENSKGKISVEEMESKMKRVLETNAIDLQKQLKLVDLASSFKDYFLKKTDIQKIKKYELTVYDAASAGKILKGLEQKEISNIELLKTEYSKLEDLKIELKGKAVLKARRQAEEMVEGLGQDLGKAIYISDLSTNVSQLLNGRAAGLNVINIRGVSQEQQLAVDFDKIRVDASVTVYFELK